MIYTIEISLRFCSIQSTVLQYLVYHFAVFHLIQFSSIPVYNFQATRKNQTFNVPDGSLALYDDVLLFPGLSRQVSEFVSYLLYCGPIAGKREVRLVMALGD